MEPMVFDNAEPIRIPVKYDGKWYALCEPSELATRNFQQSSMSGLDMDLSNIDMSSPENIKASLKKGVRNVDLSKLSDSRAVLVTDCLFNCEYNETDKKITKLGEKVTKEFVDSLPGRMVGELFTKAKEIGELDKLPTVNPFQSEGQNSTKIG